MLHGLQQTLLPEGGKLAAVLGQAVLYIPSVLGVAHMVSGVYVFRRASQTSQRASPLQTDFCLFSCGKCCPSSLFAFSFLPCSHFTLLCFYFFQLIPSLRLTLLSPFPFLFSPVLTLSNEPLFLSFLLSFTVGSLTSLSEIDTRDSNSFSLARCQNGIGI